MPSIDCLSPLRYAAAVQPHARVELADPARDRPNRIAILASAIVALLLGIAAASIWLRGEPPLEATPSAAPPTAPAPQADAGDDVRAKAPPAAIVSNTNQPALRDAGLASDAALPRATEARRPEAPVAVQRETRLHGAGRIERGRVAYVRCDGLAQHAGPFPCPRDRPFERSVWRALRGLERCESALSARGSGEVRIEFVGQQPALVQISAGDGGAMTSETVTKCAGLELAAVRCSLRPERMIVSFSFALR